MTVKLSAHVNNIALHHMVFALPFAYMSAFLAARNSPPWHELFWITLAIAGARSAAMALDNLADLKFDRQQPRLGYRAMVQGRIGKKEALASILLYLGVFLFAVLQLRPICFKLLPLAVVPFVIYPYTKRFTWLCHWILGGAIAMAPAGAWVAVTGEITRPMVILCTAVALWIGAFDAVYGSQDEAFDKEHHLHSLAVRFGAKNALRICRVLHGLSILLFFLLGILLHLMWLYYVGVIIAALTLLYQHHIVRADDFHRVTQVYFMRNGVVSMAMFLFTVLSLWIS